MNIFKFIVLNLGLVFIGFFFLYMMTKEYDKNSEQTFQAALAALGIS